MPEEVGSRSFVAVVAGMEKRGCRLEERSTDNRSCIGVTPSLARIRTAASCRETRGSRCIPRRGPAWGWAKDPAGGDGCQPSWDASSESGESTPDGATNWTSTVAAIGKMGMDGTQRRVGWAGGLEAETGLSGVISDREAGMEAKLRGAHCRSSLWTELCLVPTAAHGAAQQTHLKKGL